jgi:uroporphyrinogen III methyltransferase/synthase
LTRARIASCASLEEHLGNASQTLAGKSIVVTRVPEQSRELVAELEARGAEVLLIPLVRFADPQDTELLDEAVRSVTQFDWIVFTSQNAVRFLCKRCRELGFDCHKLQSPGPMVAAVGPATSRSAEEEGFRVDKVSTQARASALARELSGAVTGRRVLLPRSDRAGKDLPRALAESGAQAIDVVAYRTVLPDSLDPSTVQRITDGKIDVVTFASPSAFENFADMLGPRRVSRVAGKVAFAAIGPTTVQAIRAAGYPVAIEAAVPSSAGLTEAIEHYFDEMPARLKSS